MKITQMTVTMGKTINLGNYGSARTEVSVTAELAVTGPKALESSHEKLTALVKDRLHRQIEIAKEV